MAEVANMKPIESNTIAPFDLIKGLGNVSDIVKQAAGQCEVEVSDVDYIYPATRLQGELMVFLSQEQGAFTAQYVSQLGAGIRVEKLRMPGNLWLRCHVAYIDHLYRLD